MTQEKYWSKRTSHIELPAATEIRHITKAEAKREQSANLKNRHFVDFTSIKQVLENFNEPTHLFDFADLAPEEILKVGANLLGRLMSKILSTKISKAQIIVLENAYNYLSEADTPKLSDFIFVFGAKTPLRAEKAIELYKEGLAPKIIFSGRGPFYGKSEKFTEAEKYAQIALDAGVPKDAMIIEDESITIPDNVRRTLNMLDL